MLLNIRCLLLKLNQEFTLEGNAMLSHFRGSGKCRISWWLFGELGIGFGIDGWFNLGSNFVIHVSHWLC